MSEIHFTQMPVKDKDFHIRGLTPLSENYEPTDGQQAGCQQGYDFESSSIKVVAPCELCGRQVLPIFLWSVKVTQIILRDGEPTPSIGSQKICVKCLHVAIAQGLPPAAINGVVQDNADSVTNIIPFPIAKLSNL